MRASCGVREQGFQGREQGRGRGLTLRAGEAVSAESAAHATDSRGGGARREAVAFACRLYYPDLFSGGAHHPHEYGLNTPMEPLPVFVKSAALITGIAAAMARGSDSVTLKSAAAPLVGRIRKLSPAAGGAVTIRLRPSATKGSRAVPLPVIGTATLVSSRVNV